MSMLFQMCYGPEIESIYNSIKGCPGQNVTQLKKIYQYTNDGDITSLIESAVIVLEDLKFIRKEESHLFVTEDLEWSNKEVLRRIQTVCKSESRGDESLNYTFTSLYEHLFVKPDTMFITNIHYQVNNKFNKTLVGHEKINAWKRMMECWGLGRRVYSGFYALPHLTLLQDIIKKVGEWEGGIHPFCEKYIQTYLPCITSDGNIFKGTIFGLVHLHNMKFIELSFKQDLPYKSYGKNNEWNWIKFNVKDELHDTVSK